MTLFTPEELAALRAPFPLDMHTIREGYKSGSKMKWFAYVERSMVQDRLDELFPGEWGTTEPKLYFSQSQYTDKDGNVHIVPIVSATVGISIRGIVRWDGGDSEGDESTKGALTNAFRRTAAYGWGIARYLYDGVMLESQTWERNQWDKRNAAYDAVWKQFETWYNRAFVGTSQNAQKQPAASAKSSATQATGTDAPKTSETLEKGTVRDFSFKGFTTKQDSSGKPYYSFETVDGQFGFYAFSRDVFRAVGIPDTDSEAWKTIGTRKKFEHTMSCVYTLPDGKDTGYWLFNLPKVESPSEIAF